GCGVEYTPAVVGPRFDSHSPLKPRTPANLHVLFPLVVAGEARLAVARIARGCRSTLRTATNRKTLCEFAVEPHVELLRPPHAFDVVLILPLETDLDDVLPIHWEVVIDRDPAARSKWKVFALTIFLQNMERNFESIEFGR